MNLPFVKSDPHLKLTFVSCLLSLFLIGKASFIYSGETDSRISRLSKETSVDASQIELQSERQTLVVSKSEKGAIVSIRDKVTGVEFIAPQEDPKLFKLAFSKKAEIGGVLFYLSNQDAESFSSKSNNSTVTLSYSGFGEWPVQVTCTGVISAKDNLVHWRLSVRIPESLVLESVQFPIVMLKSPLGESSENDAAVFGHTKGGVIRNPGSMKVGSRASGRQPGTLAAQFGCYYDDLAGLYLASYDGKGYPKDFELLRTAEGIQMDWNLQTYSEKSYSMNFDVVMSTFTGADKTIATDWRDAADIYKKWALQQPWCATLYADRNDIPQWLKDGPAMVRFTREWLKEPDRILKWITDYWKKNFPDAPLITAYWGWEKVGNWVTPDYFPVFPSDEQFKNIVAQSRLLGCHAFPWPSGYHWSLTYRKQDDGTFSWDDRKLFDEVAKPHAIYKRDKQLYIRVPSWLYGGETACMCPGDPWTINWWNKDICVPLTRLGCEMIQVDQVVGGSFPFCYSPQHPHPPGPGLWMSEVFKKQLKTMYTTMQKIERDAVVCYEEPNEQFNHLAAIQDYRDCESSNELASVFNYLYHEYLPTFQSNPREGDIFMKAYCCVNGQMPHMNPARRDIEMMTDSAALKTQKTGVTEENKLMRRWVELYHGEGRPWLQYGRMLHPPKLLCETISFQDKRMPALLRRMPAVLLNAFSSPDGSEAVVLANATLEPQKATLYWKGKELLLDLKPGEIVLYPEKKLLSVLSR